MNSMHNTNITCVVQGPQKHTKHVLTVKGETGKSATTTEDKDFSTLLPLIES